MNMPIKVTKSEQTCALGACMFAAVAGGVYTTLDEAQLALEQGVLVTYHPCEDKSKLYNEMYQEYLKIGTK